MFLFVPVIVASFHIRQSDQDPLSDELSSDLDIKWRGFGSRALGHKSIIGAGAGGLKPYARARETRPAPPIRRTGLPP
jgi:hypothetical protein